MKHALSELMNQNEDVSHESDESSAADHSQYSASGSASTRYRSRSQSRSRLRNLESEIKKFNDALKLLSVQKDLAQEEDDEHK